jgi:phosphohistidine phosphatase
MKTIYLVRHAKASRDKKGLKDWERSLTVDGVRRAQKVAKKLYSKKVLPKRMASSYAFRSLNTAIIFATTLRIPVSSIEIYSSLYEKKASDIINMLKKQDDSVESLMLFGHNPSISDICNRLTRKKNKELPTSAVACIQFKATKWSDIGKFAGKLIFIESGK